MRTNTPKMERLRLINTIDAIVKWHCHAERLCVACRALMNIKDDESKPRTTPSVQRLHKYALAFNVAAFLRLYQAYRVGQPEAQIIVLATVAPEQTGDAGPCPCPASSDAPAEADGDQQQKTAVNLAE